MQIVKVFISSTFTDFTLERNVLHNIVFPRIKKLCREHDCEFQSVDLRWGISEKDGMDHSSLEICLEELKQCQRVTPRPNFIFLSGNRYGWRPVPPTIPAELFLALAESENDSRKRELMEDAYKPDLNSADGEYAFVHIPAGCTETDLRRILSEAADRMTRKKWGLFPPKRSLTTDERSLLFASTTHRELLARLSLPDFAGSAICAVRTLKNVPEGEQKLYLDLDENGLIDLDAFEEAAKAGKQAESLCPNTYVYELDITAAKRDPEKELAGFAEFIYAKMESHILSELERSGHNPLRDEVNFHRDRMNEMARYYKGDATELRHVISHIRDGKTTPLIVIGKASGGISAFMAKAASLLDKKGVAVFYRSVGLTGNSTDCKKVLADLRKEIEGSGVGQGQVIFLDGIEKAHNPRSYLREILTQFADDVCLVLSMNDDFSETVPELLQQAEKLTLASITRPVLQNILDEILRETGRTLTAPQRNALLKAYDFHPNMHTFITLMKKALKWRSFDEIDDSDGSVRALIGSVGKANKNLPPILTKAIRGYLMASRDGLCGTELQGVLSHDREVMGEFLKAAMHLLPGTEEAIYRYARKCGASVKDDQDVLDWIHGLRDFSEILDAILGPGNEILLPDVYFSRALYDLMPFLSEKLSQGRRVYVIDEGAMTCIETPDSSQMRKFHSRLADYFSFIAQADEAGRQQRVLSAYIGSTSNSRVARELPYQYLHAERYDDLFAFLSDPDWLVFLYRWDRAELSALWSELEKRSCHTIIEGYAPLLPNEDGNAEKKISRQEGEALTMLLSMHGGHQRELAFLQQAMLDNSLNESPDMQLQLKAQIAQQMMEEERYEETLAYIERLIRDVSAEKSIGFLDLLYVYGVALFRVERYAEAKTLFEEGYELALTLGNEDRIRSMLKWKASCEKVTGNSDEASRIYDELTAKYEQDEDKEALIAANYEQASNLFLFGSDRRKAFELVEKAAALAQETGYRTWLVKIYELAINMCSVSQDYPKLRIYSLKYLDAWQQVNPGRKVPIPMLISYLIAITKTEPTSESMFITETCMLLEEGGLIPDQAACIVEHPYGNTIRYTVQKALSYMPKELQKIIKGIPPAPEVYTAAYDEGIRKYTAKLSEKGLESFKQSQKEFNTVAGKALTGEPLIADEHEPGKTPDRKILELRTSIGFLLLYLGFDPIERVYQTSGAEQAEFISQVHLILFQQNYGDFRSLMTYNEYAFRLNWFSHEKALFERYKKERADILAGESDLVRSLVEKLSKKDDSSDTHQ